MRRVSRTRSVDYVGQGAQRALSLNFALDNYNIRGHALIDRLLFAQSRFLCGAMATVWYRGAH